MQHGQHREQFQTPQEHGDAQNGLGKIGQSGIGAGCAGNAKGRANASHSRDTDPDGIKNADSIKSQKQCPESDEHQVQKEKLIDPDNRILADKAAIHLHVHDHPGMKFFPDSRYEGTAEDDDTGNFDSRRRRAAATTADHQKQQDSLGKRWPLVIVSRNKSCRSNGSRLEGGIAQCRKDIGIKGMDQIGGNTYGRQKQDEQVGLEFRVFLQGMESLAV